MGTVGSVLTSRPDLSPADDNDDDDDLNENSTSISFVEWKVFPSQSEAIKKFLADGTLKRNYSVDQLELRALLDEPIAQSMLGKFATAVGAINHLLCWSEIQEYKGISADSYRRSTALYIFDTYINKSSRTVLNLTSPLENKHMQTIIEASERDPSRLLSNFFNEFQFICFSFLVQKLYKPFKLSDDFNKLNDTLKHKYNNVRLSHFKYFSKVGEGGFGFVVKCKKVSTGKLYAMKIQPKTTLLKHSRIAPHKVMMEKSTMVACRHPFIVNLEYAFQTEGLAILVVELSLVDLHHYQTFSPGGHLREDHVRFYAAEMVLALGYMHQMGLIYRDLKPQNILLHEDGHIRLIDLGCVMDVKGRYTWDTADDIDDPGIGKKASRLPDVAVLAESIYEPARDDAPYSYSHFLEEQNSNGYVLSVLTQGSGTNYSRASVHHDECSSQSNNNDIAETPPKFTPQRIDLLTGNVVKANDNGNNLEEGRPSCKPEIGGLHEDGKGGGDDPQRDNIEKPKISVMGTLGYMPPEMVIMLNQKKAGASELYGNDIFNPVGKTAFIPMEERLLTLERRKRGYDNSVDWWALGVTMYKLMTGTKPFAKDEFNEFVKMNEELSGLVKENFYCTEFRRLFQVVDYPENLSSEAIDLMQKLMDVNPETRLGAGRNGLRNIKKHPFFQSIDWNRLEQKLEEPPFVPRISAINQQEEMVAYPDIRTLLAEHGRWGWLEETCDSDMQQYFLNWDYIAPHTLREEAGLAQNFNTKAKNRRTGPKDSKVSGTRCSEMVCNEKLNASSSNQRNWLEQFLHRFVHN